MTQVIPTTGALTQWMASQAAAQNAGTAAPILDPSNPQLQAIVARNSAPTVDNSSLDALLNSGNYSGAFGLANQYEAPIFGSQVNPYLQDLETSSGLQSLDPSLQWTQGDVNNYYNAASQFASSGQNALGINPDTSNGTEWGSNAPGKYASDAATNWSTNPNSAPDLARYAGDIPSDPGYEKITDGAIAATLAAAAGVATGGAADAAIGGLGGALAGGAAGGASSAAVNDAANNQPLTLGSVGRGALTGAVSGGISNGLSGAGDYISAPLQDAGVNSTLANAAGAGIIKGALGAGAGALGGALSGYGAGNGALVGGISGAASGAVSNATDSSTLGKLAGTAAGYGASTLVTPPNGTMASLPAATSAATSLPALPGSTTSTPTNIGSYSGYGYAPRQVNPNAVTDYDTYGQGPEASFFQPAGTSTTLPAADHTSVTATDGEQVRPGSTLPAFPPATATNQNMPTTPMQRI